MSTPPSLVVSEIFGPTVSGEGPTTGQRCGFIRLGACNLHCSWCDTPYTWDASRFDLSQEMTRLSVADIIGQVLAMNVDFVIISGGEPLLQQIHPGWTALLNRLRYHNVRVEIETNGTIAPNASSVLDVARFTVSPKLAHAGDPAAMRLRPEVIEAFRRTRKAVFKFVCTTAADVAEAEGLAKEWGLEPNTVWIMPEGTDTGTLCDHLAVITNPAILAGFNVTTRLHIHSWQNERGR